MKILNQKDLTTSPTMIDYERWLALGKVDGCASLTKFGRVVATISELMVSHDGVYGMPSTAENVVITSTSADDAPAGLGARTVQLLGIDDNDDLVTEIVSIDSVSVNKYKRVPKCRVVTSGTVSPTGVNGNLGVLTITQDTSLVEMVKVPVNEGSTMCACFTVPKGYTALIKYADTTILEKGKEATNKLKTRCYNNPDEPFTNEGERSNYENQVGREFTTPTEVKEMTDIVFTSITNVSTTLITGIFVIELIENSKNGLV